MRYMLDVRTTFRHEDERLFLVSVGLNHKGEMDDDEFLSIFIKIKHAIVSQCRSCEGTVGVHQVQQRTRTFKHVVACIPAIPWLPVVSWWAQYNGRDSGTRPKLWSISVEAEVKP